MHKKSIGLLLGAAAGAIAFRLAQDSEPVVVPIVVDQDERGGARISTKPVEVDLRFRQRIIWRISNRSHKRVRVSMENWRRRNEDRVVPAAYALEQPGLWCAIEPGDTGEITAKGRLAEFIICPEICLYDVYLNDEPGPDPIVRLIL